MVPKVLGGPGEEAEEEVVSLFATGPTVGDPRHSRETGGERRLLCRSRRLSLDPTTPSVSFTTLGFYFFRSSSSIVSRGEYGLSPVNLSVIDGSYVNFYS